MQLHVIPVDDITVPKNRQRRYFDEAKIQELAASIADNSLIHPVVVRSDEEGQLVLVAGERRLRALDILWGYGEEVVCNDRTIPERCVPCVHLGEIDAIDAYEVELEENIRRTDLSWQETSRARAELFELRRLQAQKNGTAEPSVTDIAREIAGDGVKDSNLTGQLRENVRQDIILARHLDDPSISKAPSRKEAFKALRRKEETRKNAELGKAIGLTYSAAVHTLRQGDCLSIMAELQPEIFDVVLTDPPYGIEAQDFGDSGGKTAGAHAYDDSYETWQRLMDGFAKQIERITKPQAHLYLFCDIDRFAELKFLIGTGTSWNVFRTPLIWINPSAMRAPWPEMGPQRKWQMILFAVKGNKPVTRLYGDVITCQSDPNLGHQAQKPVALYSDLLRRSVRPGDSVLDAFAGTGTIYPACHEHQCKGFGIELDASACGIAAKRLEGLK